MGLAVVNVSIELPEFARQTLLFSSVTNNAKIRQFCEEAPDACDRKKE